MGYTSDTTNTDVRCRGKNQSPSYSVLNVKGLITKPKTVQTNSSVPDAANATKVDAKQRRPSVLCAAKDTPAAREDAHHLVPRSRNSEMQNKLRKQRKRPQAEEKSKTRQRSWRPSQ